MEEDYEGLDFEASLLSCRPRAVDFTDTQQSGELGRQRNVGEETRTKVAQQEFSGSGMIASITRVCYGTLNQKSACIIVFRFSFRWSKDDYQFKRVEIEITFEPRSKRPGSSTGNARLPVVRNLSPGKAYGIPNANGRKWFHRVEQQCTVPTIAPSGNSTTDNFGQKAFEEAHRLDFVGKRWSDSRRREFHKACWVIKEIGEPNFGIPDEVNVAVLVDYEDGFQADVKMTVDVPLFRRLRGFPWPADDPIVFAPKCPGALIGEPLRNTQFETLSDADWERLISGYEVRRRQAFIMTC